MSFCILENRNTSQETIEEANSYLRGVYIVISTVAVVINILHITLLSKVPHSKKKVYFWIVVQISFVDTVLSTVMVVYCISMYDKEPLLDTLIYVFMQTAGLCRYGVLALASIERYYAICDPLKYTSHILVHHINKTSAAMWIYYFLVSATHLLALDGLFSEMVAYIVFLANLLPPTLVILILMIKVTRELKCMEKKARHRGTYDRELKISTRYIMYTSLIFYIMLVPFFVFMIFSAVVCLPTIVDIVFNGVVHFCQCIYGIVNVVLHVHMNRYDLGKLKILCLTNCWGERRKSPTETTDVAP